MKKIYLIFSILLFIILSHLIRADTIIDSVYSVPELDGDICFTPTGQLWSLNDWSYDMHVGDIGGGAAPPPNSSIRSYVSFELPEIPEGYEIDSVFIRLYQFDSHGVSPGPIYYDFPYWDIAGGDTVQCIMSHIDYGFELDPGDWTKGDEGNPSTYNHNIGMITDSGLDGYRYLNVTPCVLLDYSMERLLNQYRISFEIDTDWDDLTDKLAFVTRDTQYEPYQPKLFFSFSDIVAVEDNNIEFYNSIFHVYPNPLSENGRIMLDSKQSCNVSLNIYNVKGQLVETLINENKHAGFHNIEWNTKNISSGIYFYKLNVNGKTEAVKKCLLLK